MHDATADRLSPQRLVRIIAWSMVIGALLDFVTLIGPHEDSYYDGWFAVVGVVILGVGATLLLAARRWQVGLPVVHASLALASAMILSLTWFGMRDSGGIQVILLVVALAMCSLLGPTWWAITLAALQSAGYALVLATSTHLIGLDKPAQWQVVTISLVVCLAFNTMVRHEFDRTQRLDDERRRERDHEREQHARKLELLNEELRDASELKSSFVAMASHELRTPLTSIEGFASTLEYRWNDLSDDDKRAFVAVIDAQSQRLRRLVTDLLTVSRIEGGRLVARPAATEIADVARRAIASCDPDLDVHVSGDLELRANVDPDHLEQVLVNYLVNARTYGAAPFEVHVADEPDTATVRIDVVDHGHGVPAEFVPHLFERFARAADQVARPQESGGTGLGLSIVLGLAAANDGEAWFEPNEPSGARFCLRVPRST